MQCGILRFLLIALTWSQMSSANTLPAIVSGPLNPIPACVTPNHLMDFVVERLRTFKPPKALNQRFSKLALEYKTIGECVQIVNEQCVAVRWDYAFFQMLFETNYLTFTGGVKPEDNNFAGIGATVAGKPGERFSSVHAGVLAHLQHVLMYSGQVIEQPVANRTKIVQQLVHDRMSRLGRPVTFSDLSVLWTGTDKNTYAASLERTAQRFNRMYCGRQ